MIESHVVFGLICYIYCVDLEYKMKTQLNFYKLIFLGL